MRDHPMNPLLLGFAAIAALQIGFDVRLYTSGWLKGKYLGSQRICTTLEKVRLPDSICENTWGPGLFYYARSRKDVPKIGETAQNGSFGPDKSIVYSGESLDDAVQRLYPEER